MSAIELPRAQRLAFRVVLGQAAVTVIAGLIAWALAGERAGLSALAGGGIATAGSLVMAVLFVVVLKVMRVAPLAMFAAFAATFLVYWIALLSALPSAGGARGGA